MAAGVVAAAFSGAAAACEPPSITKFELSDGIVNGVAVGVLEGVVPACNAGQHFPVVRLYDHSSVNVPTAAGPTFSIPVVVDGVDSQTTFGVYAEIRKDDAATGSVVASVPEKPITFRVPQPPSVQKNANVPETGGILASFGTDGNCQLTASPEQAASREENLCLVEVLSGDAVLSSDHQVLVGAGTPGGSKTASWRISKIDQSGQAHVVAADSATATVQLASLDLTVPAPSMLQATQPVSIRIAETGAMLALSKAQAVTYAQAGNPSYEIEFDHLPPGLTATEANGEIEISGRAMFVGDNHLTLTPKRVLASGDETSQASMRFDMVATLPSLGVTVPQSKSVKRYEAFTLKPSFSGGLCSASEVNAPSDPQEGGCQFEWEPPASLTSNGVVLGGSLDAIGTTAVPWRFTYEFQGTSLELASGSSNIVASEAVAPGPTVTTGQTAVALAPVLYEVAVAGCATQPTIEDALTAANSTGAAACVVSAQLPSDFLSAPSDEPGRFSGVYMTPGQKVASFGAKMALPDGTVVDAPTTQKSVLVGSHGMQFSMAAPAKVRAGKTATAQISGKTQECALSVDAEDFNAVDTPTGARKCVVSLQGLPQGWSFDGAEIAGVMGADDATLAWTVSYPIKLGDTITPVELARGSTKIASYNPVTPEFRLAGRALSDGTMGVAGRGEIGTLVIEKATAGLMLTAKVVDADGNTLLDIPRLSDKSTKQVRIPSLGELPLMQQKSLNLQVAYADEDGDVSAEKTISLIRTPDAQPSLQVAAPKRVKLGETGLFVVSLGEAKSSGFNNDPARIGTWKVHLAKANRDGTTVGLTSPQEVTATDGRIEIPLVANADWISSNLTVVASLNTEIEALQKTVKTRTFAVQEYLWPEFELDVRQPVAYAPSAVRLTLVPSDRKFFAQAAERESKVTYTWRLPEAAQNPRATGSIAHATFDQAGDYEIELDIEDVNGNKSTVTKTITVAAPKPYNVDLKMYSANKWPDRAPASFSLRPQVSGGHPTDKVTSYTLKVNGAEVHSSGASPRILALPDAGEYTIELAVASKMGATGSVTKTLTLAPNNPPTCELLQKTNRTAGTVTMKCSDSDGRIMGYEWTVDGVTKKLSRNYTSFPLTDEGVHVQVTARDDAGAETTLATTVTK